MNNKIIVLSPSFSDGGAERVMSYLVNRCSCFVPYSLSGRLDYLERPTEAITGNVRLSSNKLFRKMQSAFFVMKVVLNRQSILTCSYELFLLAGLAALIVPGTNIVFRPSIGMDYIMSEINRRFRFLSPIVMIVFKLLCSKSKIIYQSDALAETFSDLPVKRSMVISNPVAFDKAAIRALVRDNGAPLRIVYCGRLTWEKGFDRLLRCHALSNADDHIDWLCYGVGLMEAEALDRTARSTNFKYMGWASREQFERINAVMVIPSRIEGVPNIVLEAIMAGWPVLAYTEVCEIFASDAIVSNWIRPFDFESGDGLVEAAQLALNSYKFEDHMEVVQELHQNRNMSKYVKEIFNFATAAD